MKKKIAVIVILVVVLALAGTFGYLMIRKSADPQGSAEGEPFGYENEEDETEGNETAGNGSLSDLSFDNIKIGDKLPKKIMDKAGMLTDWMYLYEYEYIMFNLEGDEVSALGFYTSTNAAGEVTAGIEDANIEYQGKKLVTVEDFEACFGEGEIIVNEENPNYTYIIFEDNGLELELGLVDGELYHVALE